MLLEGQNIGEQLAVLQEFLGREVRLAKLAVHTLSVTDTNHKHD